MNEIARNAGHKLRRHAGEIWASRGGGFYGFVAMVTFLYMEGVNLMGDIASLWHLRLDLGGLIGWVVQNMVQALLTLLWSVIWPVAWISRFGVGFTSLVLLLACYATYKLIRPGVQRLLEQPEVVRGATR